MHLNPQIEELIIVCDSEVNLKMKLNNAQHEIDLIIRPQFEKLIFQIVQSVVNFEKMHLEYDDNDFQLGLFIEQFINLRWLSIVYKRPNVVESYRQYFEYLFVTVSHHIISFEFSHRLQWSFTAI